MKFTRNWLKIFLRPQLYSHIPIALRHEVQLAFKFPLNHIAWDLSNVVVWHLFLLFPQWCLHLLAQGGRLSTGKLGFDYENFFLAITRSFLSRAFVAHIGPSNYFTFDPPLFRWWSSSKGPILLFPIETPSSSLDSNPRVNKECIHATKTLTPLFLASTSSKNIASSSSSSEFNFAMCLNSFMKFQL